MKRKGLMNLQLFDDGAAGGAGSQGGAGTGNGGQTGNAGATYSYEQAEEIASARAMKAERAALANYFRNQGMSEAEITTAISDYKAKQKANQPDVSAIEQERDNYKTQLEQMQNEKVLTAKGVRTEDLDYVMFKVQKMVDDKTDFQKAAEKFLKENPRYTGAGAYRVSASASAETKGSSGNMNDSINDAIRRAIRR